MVQTAAATAVINQSGTGTNTSYAYQTAAGHANVNQLGTGATNQSGVSQSGTSTANVYQTGASSSTNVSAITQTAPGGGTANVYQGYTDTTGGTAGAGLASNYSIINSAATGGTIKVAQDGATGLTNLSEVTQDANAASASVWQVANNGNNTSVISQNSGANNSAYVHQH